MLCYVMLCYVMLCCNIKHNFVKVFFPYTQTLADVVSLTTTYGNQNWHLYGMADLYTVHFS